MKFDRYAILVRDPKFCQVCDPVRNGVDYPGMVYVCESCWRRAEVAGWGQDGKYFSAHEERFEHGPRVGLTAKKGERR